MATAVNPSARPRTVIRMGASQFTIRAVRPPFPEVIRDVNAEIVERFGPATFDRQRRNSHKADAYLSQLAGAICHAHGIGTGRHLPKPRPQRTPRRDRREHPQAAASTATPMSM